MSSIITDAFKKIKTQKKKIVLIKMFCSAFRVVVGQQAAHLIEER